MKIYAGSDHAGVRLRSRLADHLRGQGHELVDLGPEQELSCDYPDHAAAVSHAVRRDPGSYGLLVCGSGVGVCIAANKVRGIRAAQPWNVESARLCRAHNDVNVVCIGARLVQESEAIAILDTFLTTPFERGRHVLRLAKIAGIEKAEGAAHAIDAELAFLQRREVVRSIWKRDPTVFVPDASTPVADSIRGQQGWLDAPERSAAELHTLSDFAAHAQRDGFTEALWIGLGGNSLAAQALARIFPAKTGHGLALRVIDATDPDAGAATESSIDVTRTLIVIADQHGGSIEAAALEGALWTLAGKRLGTPAAAQHFAAITNSKTPLAARAKQRGYRRVFIDDETVGPRYSALSFAGLLPAALLGVDLLGLVASARRMANACHDGAAAKNPGAILGARMAALAKFGRDKLTVIMSPEIAPLAAWIEQLVAGSLGKHGKGILPVTDETLGPPEAYAPDRQFVFIDLEGGTPAAPDEPVLALQGAGHPILRYSVPDLHDLGGEFFRWEFATAVAAASIGVNPFDEPDVAEGQRAATDLLEAFHKAQTAAKS